MTIILYIQVNNVQYFILFITFILYFGLDELHTLPVVRREGKLTNGVLHGSFLNVCASLEQKELH